MSLAAVDEILGRWLESGDDTAVPDECKRLGQVFNLLGLEWHERCQLAVVTYDLELGWPQLVGADTLAECLDKRYQHAIVGNVEHDVANGRQEALAELLIAPARENL